MDEAEASLTPNAMPLRDAVAFYLSQGLQVIPMHGVMGDRCTCGGTECNAGKHEFAHLDGQWKDGRRFTAADFEPGMNVALALGPWQPGRWLVCLDFDGFQVFPGFLPETLSQKSPRGSHLFYWVPEFEPLGNWVDCFQTKHRDGYALDIRYARGKINVAPSRSAFGAYEWANWREPAELPRQAISTILNVRRSRGLPVLRRWERERKR